MAIDHVDPFTPRLCWHVGDRGRGDGGVRVVPLHKQRFDLRTGRCLDDASVAVATWPAAIVDGVVHLQVGSDPAVPDPVAR